MSPSTPSIDTSTRPPSMLGADRQGARIRAVVWALLAIALVVVAVLAA